jgi:hypothetical protein
LKADLRVEFANGDTFEHEGAKASIVVDMVSTENGEPRTGMKRRVEPNPAGRGAPFSYRRFNPTW